MQFKLDRSTKSQLLLRLCYDTASFVQHVIKIFQNALSRCCCLLTLLSAGACCLLTDFLTLLGVAAPPAVDNVLRKNIIKARKSLGLYIQWNIESWDNPVIHISLCSRIRFMWRTHEVEKYSDSDLLTAEIVRLARRLVLRWRTVLVEASSSESSDSSLRSVTPSWYTRPRGQSRAGSQTSKCD